MNYIFFRQVHSGDEAECSAFGGWGSQRALELKECQANTDKRVRCTSIRGGGYGWLGYLLHLIGDNSRDRERLWVELGRGPVGQPAGSAHTIFILDFLKINNYFIKSNSYL